METKGSFRGEGDRKITQRMTKTRWDQVVERDLKIAGMPLAEARGLAAYGHEWGRFVSASC